MIFDTVTNFVVLHYSDEKSNKLWGYFCHDKLWYAFWGGATQAMSFKDHGQYNFDLTKLSRQKEKKGYKRSSLDAILEMNPEWKVHFNDRFTWFKLLTSADHSQL